MGYTHYWSIKKDILPEDEFKKFIHDVRRIVEYCATFKGVAVGDGFGTGGRSSINTSHILLNGVGEDSHESLVIYRDNTENEDLMELSFCKTNHKPYDLVVMAILIAFKHHFPAIVGVWSDGNKKDWAPAIEICMNLCGYGFDFNFG